MKGLITISTCNRFNMFQALVWEYIRFTQNNEKYDLVVSLDGSSSDYIDFCKEKNITLIYSEAREGVGLTKNRAYLNFPDYDFYFFLDDDVELIDHNVFDFCVKQMNQHQFHHLSDAHSKSMISEYKKDGEQFRLSKTGGGYFTVFTKEALKKIGGWNTIFAKYRRFGHTEHSYRVFHQGLQPAPFIFPLSVYRMLLLHNPISVTSDLEISTNEMELCSEEQQLINEKTIFFPFQTISKIYLSLQTNNTQIVNSNRYGGVMSNKERKYFKVTLYTFYAKHGKNFLTKVFYYFLAIATSPFHPSVKHMVKQTFKS